jgi:hypothetical protein
MSDRVGLLLKMLLPSVAISIAINYFGTGTNLTLVPTTTIVLISVFLPAVAMGMALWVQGIGNRE